MRVHWYLKSVVATALAMTLVGAVSSVVAQDEKAAAVTGKNDQAEEKGDQKPEEKVDITLAEGRLELKVPKAWDKKKPKFNLIEAEFAPKAMVEAKDGEKVDEEKEVPVARLTVMASGGSIEQNIERWIGQFSQEDDSNTGDHTQKKVEKINGMTVHVVSITGTYDDRPGPFAPNGVQRPDYRMLSAIVETKVAGNYFFKMYGPKKVVDDNEKRFLEMLKTMKISL